MRRFKKMIALSLSFILVLNLFGGISGSTVLADGGISVDGDVKASFTDQEARELVKELLSDPKLIDKVENIKITYAGSTNQQIAKFKGGEMTNAKGEKLLEFDTGLALSTGRIANALVSAGSETLIDNQLNGEEIKIGPYKVSDICSLEFDLNVPGGGHISTDFSFASEEYLEYSTGNYNDKVYVLVNGKNCALIPETEEGIDISTINQEKNEDYLIYNTGKKSKKFNMPLNALTGKFSGNAKLKKGVNHVKFMIGDVYDHAYDSVLFIPSKSIKIDTVEPEIGTLSVVKNDDGSITVKRTKKDGSPATYGPAVFTLEEINFEGEKTDNIYKIKAGESEITIPLAKEGEDTPNTIANDSKEALIKDPQMGVKIDESNKRVTLRIEAPEIELSGDKKTKIKIRNAKAGEKVTLSNKDGSFSKEYVVGSDGTVTTDELPMGTYHATRTNKDGVTSGFSNTVTVVKKPVLEGDFTDETIIKGESHAAIANPSAKDGDGKPIDASHIKRTGDEDLSKIGKHTIKWTVTDPKTGLKAVKTKTVTVKPPKPQNVTKSYKDAYITVEGLEPNGWLLVKIAGQDGVHEKIKVDENGRATYLDPPNKILDDGTEEKQLYTVSQMKNGVESDSVDPVEILRTKTLPVIEPKDINEAGVKLESYEAEDGLGTEEGWTYTFGQTYTEAGALATDKEDDNHPENPNKMDDSINQWLNKRIEITTEMTTEPKPFYMKDAEKIYKLDANGNPVGDQKFKPFVGKYIIKYKVKDSDDMEGSASRLVVFRPSKPGVKAVPENENATGDFEITDALSSASIFLYDENKKPIRIEGSKKVLTEEVAGSLYDDAHHAKVKMDEWTDLKEKRKNIFSNLPDGDYYIKQRLYGINSEFSDKVTVKRSDRFPVITISGPATISITKGDVYEEPEWYVSDKEDKANGKITKKIGPTEKVDTNKVGVYKLEYKAKDSDSNEVKSIRTVIVKPKVPEIIVGNIVDGVFTPNPNGNDVKIIGEPNASAQIVKGTNKQGSFYKVVKLDKDGVGYAENLEKNRKGTAENPTYEATDQEYAVFQTINGQQSFKTFDGEGAPNDAYFDIFKENTAPKLNLLEDKYVETVKKGEEKILDSSIVNIAKDKEDGNDLKDWVRIHKEINKETQLPKEGNKGLKQLDIDTSKVGDIKVYYSLTDSDGNTVVVAKQVEVLPLPPKMTVKKDKVVASKLEENATVELWQYDPETKEFKLVETKTANGTDPVEFTDLETGKYFVKQSVDSFESDKSVTKNFNNPAFVKVKLIDDKDQPIKDVVFKLGEEEGETEEDGTASFGVDSADKLYVLNFSSDGTTYKAKALSSEDSEKVNSLTSLVGTLTKNNKTVKLDYEYAKLKIKKDVDGEFVDAHVAKITYDEEGRYFLNHLEAEKEYLVEIAYRDKTSKKTLSVAQFMVKSGEKNTIKVHNEELKVGTIKDINGKPVSGAKVTVYNPDRNNKANKESGPVKITAINGISDENNKVTGSNGEFAFSVPNDTAYVIVVSKDGYQDEFKYVESVDGNLLVGDFVLVKENEKKPEPKPEPSKDNGSSSSDGYYTNNYKPESTNDNQKDVDKTDKPADSTKPAENNKPVEKEIAKQNAKPVISDDKDKTDKVYKNGSVSYISENPKKDDKVIKEPENGKVLMNPETGAVVYVPKKGAKGKDQFTIETRNKNGEKVELTKQIDNGESAGSFVEPEPALVMEINTPNKKGFVGQEFDFEVDLKNEMSKDVDKATIAVKIPKGFVPADDFKYKVKSDYIIIPVKDVKAGKKDKFKFKLKATSANLNNQIDGLVQEDGKTVINPKGISSTRVKVYELNKKYEVKPYVKGMPDGNFYKNKSVTRAEIAAMLTRCLDNENSDMLTTKTMSFSDVSADAWYDKYVKKAVAYNLFNGFKDGTFKPNKSITRAELAKVIANYFEMDISESGRVGEPFTDVSGHWAEDEMYALKRYGIVNGYKDGSYQPNKPLSREEAVKMINKMLFRDQVLNVDPSFNDTHSKQWSFGEIESAYRGYWFMMNTNGKLEMGSIK